MKLYDRDPPCFTAATLSAQKSNLRIPQPNTTTTIIASISMARPSKRSFQLKELLKEARSKKLQREDRVLQTALEALAAAYGMRSPRN